MKDILDFEEIIKDENNYMKGTLKGALDSLYILSSEDKKLKHLNNAIYSEEKELYEEIIRDCYNLINCLNIEKNIFSCFITYNYLLWNGYFSKNKIFNYCARKGTDSLYVDYLEYLNIMSGFGNCYAITSNFTNLLNLFNYNNIQIVNDTATIKTIKEIPIKRYENDTLVEPINHRINEYFKIVNRAKSKKGMHISNLIRYHKKYYILDSTNLAIFKVIDENNIKRYNAIGKSFISPWGFILKEGMSVEEIYKLYKKFNKHNEHFISEQELNKIIYNTINVLNNSTELLDDFYIQNEDNINAINKMLVKKLK